MDHSRTWAIPNPSRHLDKPAALIDGWGIGRLGPTEVGVQRAEFALFPVTMDRRHMAEAGQTTEDGGRVECNRTPLVT
jgi:hypothetical protein